MTATILEELAAAVPEWRTDIENAPSSDEPYKTFLVATLVSDKQTPITGEAYHHTEDDSWWWANTRPGDEYADQIIPAPYAWMPLPEPPSNTGSGG